LSLSLQFLTCLVVALCGCLHGHDVACRLAVPTRFGTPSRLAIAEGDTPTAYRLEVRCPVFAPVRVSLCSEAVSLGVMTLSPSYIDLTPANYNSTFIVTIQALSTAADYR
jgi:hypothetical protein